MDGILHLILLLSGLCFLSSCARQFILVNTPKTWYEAQMYCRDKGFDLATINDMKEMETVLQAVKDKYNDAVWIGLYKGTTMAWYWSLATQSFYKKGERGYFIWGGDTPYNCGSYRDGKYYTFPCTELQYSICYDGNLIGQNQYVLTPKTLNWPNARDYCRAYHTDLASVRNDLDKQTIQQVANGTQAWIGLFKDAWLWSDRTYSSMRYWKADQAVWSQPGEEKCAGLLKSESGRWGELQCQEAHPFLCNTSRTFVKFIKVRISSQDSVLEQYEAAVQDNILTQIKQNLRNKNVTGVFKLQWNKHPDGRVFIKEPQ